MIESILFCIYIKCVCLQIWLVGDGWDEDEQMKAPKGSLFIPFSQFPLKKLRKDCFYHNTPAMLAPPSFKNLHSCEASSTINIGKILILQSFS